MLWGSKEREKWTGITGQFVNKVCYFQLKVQINKPSLLDFMVVHVFIVSELAVLWDKTW